ncbi:MAG TPA: non-ribosomal peptide synthetase [Stellaceae bacterium]|jgi:amino acid adenylation domain-containing protein
MWRRETRNGAESAGSHRWSEADEQSNRSVPQRVAEHAAAVPRAIALRDGARVMTYGELDERADAVAGYLSSIGVGRETVVGIALDRSFARIIAALGVWRAGGAFLPLDPSWPDVQLRALLEDTRALAVIGAAKNVHQLASVSRLPVALDGRGDAFASFATRALRETNHADDLAYVIYTSGSSGEPKGVEITHGNLDHLVAWHQTAFDMSAADTASHLAGLGFDASIWEAWTCLATGATLTLASEAVRGSAIRLRRWLLDEEVSIAFVPTPLAEQLMSMEWPTPTRLRFLLTGGDTLHAFPRPDLPFATINNYGPAECTVVATSGRVPSHCSEGALPSIGKPIAGTMIRLLDEQGAPVAPGWPGEICIGGPSVARGYRHRRDATAARFIADPFGEAPGARLYRTGDLGSLLPNGEIAFRGRIDGEVKIRGYRVEPDRIAAALARHPVVASCAVIARKNGPGEKQLVAYLVPAGAQRVTAEELRAFLADTLPDYLIPTAFVGLAELPLTSVGKLDQNALPEPTSDNSLDHTRFRAPATRTEARLAEILAEVLGCGAIGADDNFFLSGGDSQRATEVVIRARDVFGIELMLSHLFEAQTVADLAAVIERLLAAKRRSLDKAGRRTAG